MLRAQGVAAPTHCVVTSTTRGWYLLPPMRGSICCRRHPWVKAAPTHCVVAYATAQGSGGPKRAGTQLLNYGAQSTLVCNRRVFVTIALV